MGAELFNVLYLLILLIIVVIWVSYYVVVNTLLSVTKKHLHSQ